MPFPAGDASRRHAWARVLDSLTAASVVGVVLLSHGGGFSWEIAGVEISAHDPTRLAIAGAVLVLCRLVLLRDVPVLGLPRAWWSSLKDRLFVADQVNAPLESPVRPIHVLWATLGLCAFGAVLLYPQLDNMHAVPDLGDPLFSIWRSGWVFHWLHGDPRPLFSPNIFYPSPLTLTYSDSMLVPSLMVSPLLAAGMHPVVAYNILLLSGFLLSGVTMFLLAAHVTRSPASAFVSALLFTFYPYRFEHYSHLELQMTQWMPLALLALHRFIETARTRFALGAVAAAVAQLYSSMYYGVFFALYVLPISAILLIARRRNIAALWRGTVIAGVIGIVGALPLARPYLAAQAAKGERDIPAVTFYSALPSDYFEAHDRSVMYGRRIRSEHPERALFPGVMALSLAATALVPPYGAAQVAYIGALAFGWELSLGFHGAVYPYLYEWLSPIRGLRVAARYSILVGMTLALLAAFSTRRLLARLRTPQQRAVALGVLAVLIAVDLRPKLELQQVWRAPPSIYGSLPPGQPVVLAEFPLRAHIGNFTENLPFMYFSLWHWKNMINGYSGFTPRDYPGLVDRVEDIPTPEAVDALQAAGVTHVTMNCALYASREGCMELMDVVDRSPRFKRIERTLWHAAPVTLYELQPTAGAGHSPLGSSR
ncbi:MAG: hypothetical protein ABI634_19835 [Acidobacteriota bacterium]